jgi:hypothetical protein
MSTEPWEDPWFISLANDMYLTCDGAVIDYKSTYIRIIHYIIYRNHIEEIIMIQRLYRRYKWNKRLKTLWEIAEYYTAKKYAPDKILNYVELDDKFKN